MEELFKGGFIYGFGCELEQFTIEVANNIKKATYKIWIHYFDCEIKSKFENKELSDDEIGLLTLNQLKDLTITKVHLTDNEDLILTFETEVQLRIISSNVNCVEAYRIYQQTPEFKEILTVSNK